MLLAAQCSCSLVVSRLDVPQVGAALLDHWAGVGNAAALNLQVGQALQVVKRQSLGTLHSQQQDQRNKNTADRGMMVTGG